MAIEGVTAIACIGDLDAPFDLILDGLIGYSLRGAPQARIAELIRWANHRDTPTVSLDIPSGIDATTGTVYNPVIHAAATLTLALPKTGLRKSGVKEHVGELYLADIGVPPELYSNPAIGLEVGTLFAYHEVIRLW
jgi:NAD(P)H-hydrate epimerase